MKITSLIIAWLISFNMKAQEQININLESVLQMSGAQNLTIEKIKSQQELAEAQWTKSKEWWLPNLYAGIEMHQLWGAAMNADGRFFLDVNRNNLWNGIGIQANWNFAQGIYKAKAMNLKAKAAQFETRAQRNKTILEGVNLYYRLLLAQMNQLTFYVLELQADSIAQQVALLADQGLVPQSDQLISKSQARNFAIQKLNAAKERSKIQYQLQQFLHLNYETSISAADTALYPLTWDEDSLSIPIDSVFEIRPELKALNFQQLSLKQEEKIFTVGTLIPTLSVDMYGSYFGKLSGNVRPMFPDQFPNPNQLHETAGITAALKWNIPLGRIFYKGDQKIMTSKIKWVQLETDRQKDMIYEEVMSAKQNLILSQQSMKQAEEALSLAGEALQQVSQRLQLSIIKPYEIIQIQEIFAQAQLNYWQAVVAFNTSQFAYRAAIGIDL